MIYVDIYVPSLDKEYDFNLDENATVGVLVEEIAEMICQKEQYNLEGKFEDLMLCIPKEGAILLKHQTLSECGVHTGSRIILV